jgi:hypothetical protein
LVLSVAHPSVESHFHGLSDMGLEDWHILALVLIHNNHRKPQQQSNSNVVVQDLDRWKKFSDSVLAVPQSPQFWSPEEIEVLRGTTLFDKLQDQSEIPTMFTVDIAPRLADDVRFQGVEAQAFAVCQQHTTPPMPCY